MKVRWKYIWLAAVSVILAGNLISAYLRTLATGPGVIYNFETKNAEFEFLVNPAGGTDIQRMEEEFQKFLSRHPNSSDRQLYRTFERNPWKFWNWYYFLTSDLYQYPYKDLDTSN
jgi:hypothetical protein